MEEETTTAVTAAASAAVSAAAAAAAHDWPLYGAFAALGVMAVMPIYLGAHAAVKALNEAKNGNEDAQVEHISAEDAKRFPFMGSAVLLSLYLLFYYVPKQYFQMILSGLIAFSGASVLGGYLHDWILALLPALKKYVGDPYHLVVSQNKKLVTELKFDQLHVLTFVIGCAFAVYYELTKDWIANNIFGLCLAFSAIQVMILDRFQTGFILLGGLFIYDIFWVFGTEVMVTVAKSFDAPIKVLFPRDVYAAEYRFTMLGLGDIVVPGLFIALALCFDESRRKGKGPYPKPYFIACFIAYILGLIVTVTVMQVYQAAQPALLYLSPACSLSVVLVALIRGEFNELMNFNTSTPLGDTNVSASSSSSSVPSSQPSDLDGPQHLKSS